MNPSLPSVVTDSHLPALQAEKATFFAAPAAARTLALAKFSIVESFHTFRAEQLAAGRSKPATDALWDRSSHALVAPALSELKMSKVSHKTVKKWAKTLEAAGNVSYPTALLPQPRATVSSLPPEVMASLIGLFRLHTDPRTLFIHNSLLVEHPQTYTISYRSLCRLITQLQSDRVLSQVKGPTSFKNLAKAHVLRINDNVPLAHLVSDARDLDFFVRSFTPLHHDSSYRVLIRPRITFWADVATGLIAGYGLGLSENTHIVAASLGRSILSWGTPERITTDNGSAYQNYQSDPYYFLNHRKKGSAPYQKAKALIESGQQGFYRQVGIQQITYSIPGNPESKTIEALWNIIFEDFERAHASFCGKSPERRPEPMQDTPRTILKKYGHLIPTWSEFLARISALVEHWNSSPRSCLKDHDGRPCSPLEIVRQEARPIVIPAVSFVEEALTIFTKVTMQRDGVYLNGNWYDHPARLTYLGKPLLATYNDLDYRYIHLYTPNGQLISHPAEIVDYSCFTDPDQIAKAISSTRRRDKVAIATYTRVQSELPLPADQRDINRILDTPLSEIDYKQAKASNLTKHQGFESLPQPKASPHPPTSSGVSPEPEISDILRGLALPEPQPEQQLSPLEQKLLDKLEQNKTLRGL